MATVNVDIDLNDYDPTGNGTDPSGSSLPVRQTTGVTPNPLKVHKKNPTTFQFKTKHTPRGFKSASVRDFRYAAQGTSPQVWLKPKGDPNSGGSWAEGPEFVWDSANGGHLKVDDRADTVQKYDYVLVVELEKAGGPNVSFIVDPEIHNEEEA